MLCILLSPRILFTIRICFTITIIYNKIIIIKHDSRLQDPILLLKVPKGRRKNFSENYRQLSGHALSRRFASSALGEKKSKEKITRQTMNLNNTQFLFASAKHMETETGPLRPKPITVSDGVKLVHL
jgi:hypothetical protein